MAFSLNWMVTLMSLREGTGWNGPAPTPKTQLRGKEPAPLGVKPLWEHQKGIEAVENQTTAPAAGNLTSLSHSSQHQPWDPSAWHQPRHRTGKRGQGQDLVVPKSCPGVTKTAPKAGGVLGRESNPRCLRCRTEEVPQGQQSRKAAASCATTPVSHLPQLKGCFCPSRDRF